MFFIAEAKAKHHTNLACGHAVESDQAYFRLTVSVCAADIDCLPQSIKASLQAQQTSADQRNPSFLYKLWHRLWGKKPQKPTPSSARGLAIINSSERKVIDMPQIKRYVAKQDLQLDCSHSIKAGETLVVTSVYTCEKEGTWPLAILQGCFHALQEKQAAKQPVNGEKKPLTKSVRKSQGPVQTPA